MKVLIACEYSGRVRDAFIEKGHDAISCDLLPTEQPGPHHEGDIFEILDDSFDLMIAHPPCTYLASSGLHWNGRIEGRQELSDQAVEFVKKLWCANIPKIAIENPIGRLSTEIRKPNQYIQPYQYGHDASKKTCLWLKGLTELEWDIKNYISPRWINGLPRWANQTDSGQSKLGPSEERAHIRSLTYEGWAKAMAEQWG